MTVKITMIQILATFTIRLPLMIHSSAFEKDFPVQ